MASNVQQTFTNNLKSGMTPKEAAKDAQAVIASFAHGRGLDSREASTQKRLEESIREVEAALNPADTNSPEVRKARGAM